MALMIPGVHAFAGTAADPGDPAYPVKKFSPDTSDVVYKIRDSVLAYFSPLSGRVEDIGDGIVRVRLEGEMHIKKGMRFSVYRESKPFYHPVTNELLGYTEDPVGKIGVNAAEVSDGLYDCTIIKGDIRAGDKVRITSSRIKLAFFQDRKSDWALSEAFYGALRDSGRFEILEAYTADYEPDTLSRLAEDLGAEAFLMFSTPVEGERKFLNLKLYWAEDATLFGELNEAAGHNIAGTFAPDEEFISSTLTETEPRGSYDLAGGRLIASGDVDGDGIKELVISDGNDIRIYRLKDELLELWFIKGSPAANHISLDVLDANNNGIAEIFVTSLETISDEIRMSSFVIEYDPSEGYRKIRDNMPYFLRVNGKTLLMQKFNRNEIFSGAVYEGEWDDGHYQPEKPLNLPAGVNIYGFTFVDWKNEGQTHLMTFDDSGYLYLYDEGENLKWKSDKSYGPFPFSFEMNSGSMDDPEAKWFVRGRLISVETKSGQEVVVLNRKPAVRLMPGLGSWEAEVYCLRWNGGDTMSEKLIVSNVFGAITDYLVEGKKIFLIAGSNLSAFFEKILSGEFSRGSILYYYNLPR
ncbi:MAG TPA: VCBS repeat-containing protein [Nitrospirae bacterium]|nr:VCBS repeat-containing protein [Nitrospirota bacterium]